MRKVFLEDLPKWESGRHKGNIKWKDTAGEKVRFIYDNVEGFLKIKEADSKTQRVKIEYQSTEHWVTQNDMRKCFIGVIIGKVSGKFSYMYKKNDIIHDTDKKPVFKIIEQTILERLDGRKEKAYKTKCLKCGFDEMTRAEYNLTNKCPACSNRVVVKGFNDMWTINPEVAKLLKNKKDGFLYTDGMDVKLDWICPECNNTIEDRRIDNVKHGGLSCPHCSIGISYPERLIFSLLKLSGVDFESQKVFKFAKGKRYDFFIKSRNLIIETHGSQHYDLSNTKIMENDIEKRELAKINNYNYLELNCSKSEYEYIMNNAKNTELYNIINFDEELWIEADRMANRSWYIDLASLYNSGKSLREIAESTNINYHTVHKYIRKASKNGLCHYVPQNQKRKSINVKMASELYDKGYFISDIAKKMKLTPSTIIYHLKSGGNNYKVGERLKKNSRRVICLNNKKVFSSITKATKKYNVADGSITRCCKGEQLYAGRHPETNAPLEWKYLEDYGKSIGG